MPYCCPDFPAYITAFKWFGLADEETDTRLLMPCIKDANGNDLRVNHCPCCGAYVRSIEIKKDDYLAAFLPST